MIAETRQICTVVGLPLFATAIALALVGCKPLETKKETRRTLGSGDSLSSDASGNAKEGSNKNRIFKEGDDDSRCFGLVGGELTDKRPEVALLMTPHGDGLNLCTGTWVSPTTMITASHCLANSETGNVRYVAGAGDVFTLAKAKLAMQAGIAAHKAFIGAPDKTIDAPDTGASDIDNATHDIAVLVFSESIAPAYTPVLTTKLSPSQDLTMVGYGAISIGGENSARSGTDARRRIGKNRLAKIDPELARKFDSDFYWVSGEASSDGIHANANATLGLGDSGGPLFAGSALAAVAVLTMKTPDSLKPSVDNREGVSLYASLQSDFAKALMQKAESDGAQIMRTSSAVGVSVTAASGEGNRTSGDRDEQSVSGKLESSESTGCGAS